MLGVNIVMRVARGQIVGSTNNTSFISNISIETDVTNDY